MWFHGNSCCVTVQFLTIGDHQGCPLDGQHFMAAPSSCGPSGMLVGRHTSGTPGLRWLRRLITSSDTADSNGVAGPPSLPRPRAGFLRNGSQGGSRHTSHQRPGRFFSNTQASSTETPSGFSVSVCSWCTPGPLTSPSGSRASLAGSRLRPGACLG